MRFIFIMLPLLLGLAACASLDANRKPDCEGQINNEKNCTTSSNSHDHSDHSGMREYK